MTSLPIHHWPDPERQPDFYDGIAIKRAVAWLIDVAITLCLMIPAILATAFIGLFFLPLLFLGLGFAYRWYTISRGSATLGMAMMAIELRDARGQRLDTTTAFLHTLLYHIGWMTFFILHLVSIGMIVTTRYKQSLPDMLLGTVMLNRRA